MPTIHAYRSQEPASYKDVLNLFRFEDRLIDQGKLENLLSLIPLSGFANIKKLFIYDMDTVVDASELFTKQDLLDFDIAQHCKRGEGSQESRPFAGAFDLVSGIGSIFVHNPSFVEGDSDFIKELFFVLRFAQLISEPVCSEKIDAYLNDAPLEGSDEKVTAMFAYTLSDESKKYSEEMFKDVTESDVFLFPSTTFGHLDEFRHPLHIVRGDALLGDTVVPEFILDETVAEIEGIRRLVSHPVIATSLSGYRVVIQTLPRLTEDPLFSTHSETNLIKLGYTPHLIFPERRQMFINLSDPFFQGSVMFHHLLLTLFEAAYYQGEEGSVPLVSAEDPLVREFEKTRFLSYMTLVHEKAVLYAHRETRKVLGLNPN